MNDDKKKQRASQKKSELMVELSKSDEIISELRTELKNSKDKETILNSEIRNLQSEIKYLEANKKNIEILNENIESSERNIKDLEKKLELKEKKIEELLNDKEALLNEKSEIIESKNEILQKLKEKELEIQRNSQKISELREKFKQSSSDLLSKSMQIDKLVKKDKNVDELEETIQNLKDVMGEKEISAREKANTLEERIKSLEIELQTYQRVIKELEEVKIEEPQISTGSTESTKIISNLESIIDIIKRTLPQGKSNIRLVVPEIDDITKFELISMIKEMPTKVRINISTTIDDPSGNIIVQDLKDHCKLTNYSEKKFIALNVDSSKFLIGLFIGENEVLGIYTEVLEIINLFKPTIMEPFIRGVKIN